ncbi:MAG: 16S rRNA (cytosine(1402)-N(4))-methyltransferase RsmH [Pseudomonadota bacterium]
MAQQPSAPHIPVLLDEVVAAVGPAPDKRIVDGTFGAGGYTAALLEGGARVYAFDRDPGAIAAGAAMVAAHDGQLSLHERRFSDMADELTALGVPPLDAVVLDIGVSSMQLDQAERGFSFQQDGPLDMRMSGDGALGGESAADFLNTADEAAIADVLYEYGEERQSRRVARAIVAARPLETTGDLARVVRRALGYRPHDKKDPATRSFQAMRIHVNDELGELRAGLAAAEALLREGGVLAVVSFHSLEDRIVKRFLREASGAGRAVSRHLPGEVAGPAPTFAKASKAIRPSDAEIARNPRSRSSVLRHAIRTAAPARPLHERN